MNSPTSPPLSSEYIARYRNQMLLREVGVAGQTKLSQAKVLIIGAGGLGTPAALYLAGAGIGKIGIVDPDIVEVGNLHRQVAYCQTDVGKLKVVALAKTLSERNSDAEICPLPLTLNSFNAAQIIDEYDIVLDGCDNFETRFTAADAAHRAQKPYIFGGVSKFRGQVSVFAPYLYDENGNLQPTLRCFVPQSSVHDSADGPCDDGILGPTVGIIGLMQALEAIKLIIGLEGSLIGQIMVTDLLSGQHRRLRLRRDPANL